MFQERRFTQALALAAGLHALAVFSLLTRHPETARALRSPPPASAPSFVELDLNELLPSPSSLPNASETPAPSSRASTSTGSAAASEPSIGAPAATDRAAGEGDASAAVALSDSNLDSSNTLAGGSAAAAPSGSAAAAPSGSAAAVPSGSGAASSEPHLSLQALGMLGGIREGTPGPLRLPLDATARAEQRLETSMAQATLNHDQQLGLHAAGPLLRSLHEVVGRSNTPVNSRAIFSAILGPDGRITSLEIVESEGPRAAWDEVTQRVSAALAGKISQLPKQPRGVQLIVEIVSREELPSGADPGMNIQVGGVTLKRGKGKKSASLTILGPPKIVERTIKIGKEEVKVPQLELPLIGLQADPADIGAHARRMVHTRLLKQRAL